MDPVTRPVAVPFPMGACIAGLVLAPVKLLYGFLPLSSLVDAVLFFGVGFVLGPRRGRPRVATLCLVCPAS